MAITADTLRVVEQARRDMERLAASVTRDLTSAWIRAWDTLAFDFAAAIDELTAGGAWPTRGQVARAARTGQALDLAGQALERLAAQAAAQIAAAAQAAADEAVAVQAALIDSQLPSGTRVRFNRVPDDEFSAMVSRSGEQIHAFTFPLAAAAADAMRQELIRGMATGQNPRDVARSMLARVEGAFNGGLARALNIARTEILDAHREAAMLAQLANSDVIMGWVWLSALTPRTCGACWALHGSFHPLTEPGPWDHPSGRCTRTPAVRPWKDLGIDLPEPASLIPDARAVFAGLPRADQLTIMGPGRLAALDSGALNWSDIPRYRDNPGWRGSWHTAPLGDLATA